MNHMNRFARPALAGAVHGPGRIDDLAQHRLIEVWAEAFRFATRPSPRGLERLRTRVAKWMELPKDAREKALREHDWLMLTIESVSRMQAHG